MPALHRSEEQPPTSIARKALCIGIQYDDASVSQYTRGDHPSPLRASHGDPDTIVKFLIDLYDYKAEDIVVLKDDGKHIAPTRDNILKAIDNLIKGAKAGDRFVFHYSGHGGQVDDDDGDEEDGKDETIYPVDVVFDKEKEEAVANFIRDDDLKKHLVDSLPAGTYLTVVLDCCHSGTGIDLPNTRPEEEDQDLREMWSPVTNERGPFTSAAGQEGAIVESHLKQELDNVESVLPHKIVRKKYTKGTDNKYVTSWGACVDSEIELEGPNGGLLTRAFNKVLRANCSMTHEEFIRELGKELVLSTRPAKQVWTERGWGPLSCPRPVLASLQKLEKIYPQPFKF